MTSMTASQTIDGAVKQHRFWVLLPQPLVALPFFALVVPFVFVVAPLLPTDLVPFAFGPLFVALVGLQFMAKLELSRRSTFSSILAAASPSNMM